MIPSENEWTIATEALAKATFKARGGTDHEWEHGDPDWDPAWKQRWLEAHVDLVTSVLAALPDRLEPIRQLLNAEIGDQQFRRLIVKLLDA